MICQLQNHSHRLSLLQGAAVDDDDVGHGGIMLGSHEVPNVALPHVPRRSLPLLSYHHFLLSEPGQSQLLASAAGGEARGQAVTFATTSAEKDTTSFGWGRRGGPANESLH